MTEDLKMAWGKDLMRVNYNVTNEETWLFL